MSDQTCIIIGASHAGINCAFALRKEGWEGKILVFDTDPALPYHRPPLSKVYLTADDPIEKYSLKSAESYEKENIELHLGKTVSAVDRDNKSIELEDGHIYHFDQLVLATGASPFIPPIQGIKEAKHCYPLRTAKDVNDIRNALQNSENKKVVIIGGGYIGLETAASLKKMDADVTVLERESRILARVTAPETGQFFHNLHEQHGVRILANKNVTTIETDKNGLNKVICSDDSSFEAAIIIIGVGIRVNTQLAVKAGLDIENGIRVDRTTQTNDASIYAIGDCTQHYNEYYDRQVRLESVQNAVDQARVAAAVICGKDTIYHSIPWFWSDQYDVKLQIVGLSDDYNQVFVREEEGQANKFSTWYFKDDQLLAVDAVNNAKAYVLGTKWIKSGQLIDKEKLVDAAVNIKEITI